MNLNEMQSFVNRTMYVLGAEKVLVTVQNTGSTIAGAVGAKAQNIPLIAPTGVVVAGIIFVNERYLQHYNAPEIEFILAHESAHIYSNHSITSLFWRWLEKTLKGEGNENYDIVEILKILLAITSPQRLPPNALTLREQEYEADALAIRVTDDLESAISCLTKLVNGKLDSPSHTWELFDLPIAAMRMGTRIDELCKRSSLMGSAI